MFARTCFWSIVFVVASGLDLFCTWLLLAGSDVAYEANPLAAYILKNHGWLGLSLFKGGAVVFVTSLGLAININYPRSALRMFRISSALVLCVLAYSVFLFCPWTDPEGYRNLAEARQRSEALQRRHQSFRRFMDTLDQLAQAVLAKNISLVDATASLHGVLEQTDYNPFPSLRLSCGESATDQACLAAQLVRNVGFLVQTDPIVREQTKAWLEDEFDAFDMPLPEYSTESFEGDHADDEARFFSPP